MCRITNLEESFSRKTTMPLPARTLTAQPSGADCRNVGVAAAGVWGGGGSKRRDQVVVPVSGDAGLEIASLSTKKGPRSWENCSDWH